MKKFLVICVSLICSVLLFLLPACSTESAFCDNIKNWFSDTSEKIASWIMGEDDDTDDDDTTDSGSNSGGTTKDVNADDTVNDTNGNTSDDTGNDKSGDSGGSLPVETYYSVSYVVYGKINLGTYEVVLSSTNATEGETITVEINFPNGFLSITGVYAYYNNENYYTEKDGYDSGWYTYHFTMPAADVKVKIYVTDSSWDTESGNGTEI